MKKSKLLFLLIAVISIAMLFSAQTDTNSYSGLGDNVKQWMAEYDVPAVGLGIIENGEIVYAKVFGELEKGVPAPENTIFNVASITKTVVTSLTLKLVESGQWDLNESLSNYWVDPDVANDPVHKKLTTYHILTHQTGFVNWRWNHPTKKLTFDFEPGTKFQYSGEGFEYLRHALENTFGKSIEQLADSLIFKPLGMPGTRFGWDQTGDESRFAAWHDAEGKKYDTSHKTSVNAADDLHTTVEEYCKFGIFVMNGGGLSLPLYNEMVHPQSDIKKYRSQGLGWSVIKGLPNNEYVISHGGSDYGVKTLAYFLPKSKRGVVVFTNGDNGFAVINAVTESTFDIGNEIYRNMYYRPNLPEVIYVPTTLLDQYSGRYKEPDGSISLITRKDSVLVISGGRWTKTLFYPEAENKFFRREFDSQLEFIEDNGEISSMITYHDGNRYSEAMKIE